VKLQKFAEDWLNLIHAGRFDESWNQLSKGLQRRYTKENWAEMMRSSLTGLGTLTSRKLRMNYSLGAAGLVTLDFDVTFAKSPLKTETVVLDSSEGEWHVFSYARH
jgi:hypothetical protein